MSRSGLALTGATVAVLLLTSAVTCDLTRQLGGSLEFRAHGHEGLRLTSSAAAQGAYVPKRFSATLGVALPAELLREVHATADGSAAATSVGLDPGTRLKLAALGPECTEVTWTSQDLPELRDCVDFGSAQWFGGPQQWEQLWPVQKLVKQNQAYYTKNADNMGVAERFWLSSEGVYLYVEPEVPLFIDSNATGDNRLCFVAKFEEPYITVSELTLRYQVCTLPTARDAHLHALNSVLNAHPSQLPDEAMVRYPIWSTWARYKQNINETITLQYAQEIIDNGFKNSQLEIDDDWETCYGELAFDPVKFPDPASMTRQLNALGFRTTLWIHPFVNSDCPSFEQIKENGYFTSDKNGNIIGSWWNGNSAGMIDFTNPNASLWFQERLTALQVSSGIDSFKFDAGETGNLPNPVLQGDPRLQPNSYSAAYVRAVANFGTMAEVRAAARTQDVAVFVRMLDKDSRWGWNNGLKTVVTTLLQMTTSGYPYVLPDMIGGNGYGSDVVTAELFVRWLQATVFMPALQFSYVPWDFQDPQVVEICRQLVALHEELAVVILQAAAEAMTSGWPINSPVWYADEVQDDQIAFAVDDEFLLGRRLLVAPVLDEGATARDVYLPRGQWLDGNTGTLHAGPAWLRDYPAPLHVLPYFTLQIARDN